MDPLTPSSTHNLLHLLAVPVIFSFLFFRSFSCHSVALPLPLIGIFHGKGTTKTAPSPTLFVTNISGDVKIATVRALFTPELGFVALRNSA